jgi:alpha-glucosidase
MCELRIALDGGAVRYSVSRASRAVIQDAGLGLDLRPGGLWGQGLEVTGEQQRSINQTYPIIAGKTSVGHDSCHELTVSFRETDAPQRRIDIALRAYDDGVALRYLIPQQPGLDELLIVAERTEFSFAADHACWPTTYPHFVSSFESEYPRRKLSDLKPGGLVGLPLTIQIESGPALAIAEAGLLDYAGMYLERLSASQMALVSRLAPLHDGTYGCVRGRAPHASPWRVIMLADAPAGLIANNMLYDLCPPCAIADPSWIKPGKVTWDWWSGRAAPGKSFEGSHSTDLMKHYVDFAAELGLEYMLVDGGWYRPAPNAPADVTQSIPELDLPGLVRYATQRGVDVMVWNHWTHLGDQFDRAFAYYQSIGVRGVKVDFFDRDDQDVVNHITRLVKKAAEYRLVVDLHGMYKPTGIERTWPNLLTHEGVLGAEYNKWSARVTPQHNVTIPFTRMLAGPMDYTPGAFVNVTAERFVARDRCPMVMGTRCHNLAMYVVYQSGLQMVSDHPDAIRAQPGADFLKLVPAAWDQTLGLGGEIGQFVVVARRRGRDWFIAAMNAGERRPIDLPLCFLGSGRWEATIWSDGPAAATDPTDLTRSVRTITAGESLSLDLASAGGCAVQLCLV